MSRGLPRWERLGAASYLTGLVLVALVLAVPALRRPALARVERAVDLRERGWIARVAEAERLLGEGRFEEAERRFEILNREFPARVNLHALDKERERILVGLGRAHEALGRKSRALAAYRAAVAFDPRNVENHYALAAAALRLDEPEEAAVHLDRVLSIHPSHRRALRARIALDFERGDWDAVIETFERYLAAIRFAEIAIRAGEVHLPATIEVDGRPRKVQVPWPDAASGLESVRIEFPPEIELDGLAWEARPRAGVAGVESGRAVPGGPPRPVDADGGGAASPRLAQDWTLPATSIRRIELAATARIPLDPATRDRVETSYRNRLALDRLRAASGRLVLVPLDEEAR